MKRYCLLITFLTSVALSQSPVPSGATLEKIVGGLKQPEGPVWKDGIGLLFSDIAASTIYKWTPTDSATIYLKPSDSSNGLTLDLQGHLILTQMQSRRMSRQEANGTITVLAATYNGKKFNSPNDVVVKSDSSIFFTDPDFNIPAGQQRELSFKGIFRISPAGTVRVLDSTLALPNGICFSRDEKKLYVNDSQVHKIYVWDVVDDSVLANKRLLYTIPMTGYADGMKIDSAENIYCAGPSGIWIVDSSGTYLGKIATPSPDNNPSNCAWGDADRKTLYITAGKSLYRIRLAPAVTKVKSEGSLQPKVLKLYANFPNPFNPSTHFKFTIPALGFVTLKIFDVVGKEIATVVNGWKNAGSYVATWDASRFASGIYYYRLTAGGFSETKKMILLK